MFFEDDGGLTGWAAQGLLLLYIVGEFGERLARGDVSYGRVICGFRYSDALDSQRQTVRAMG